jgi:hypothetical protein
VPSKCILLSSVNHAGEHPPGKYNTGYTEFFNIIQNKTTATYKTKKPVTCSRSPEEVKQDEITKTGCQVHSKQFAVSGIQCQSCGKTYTALPMFSRGSLTLGFKFISLNLFSS